MDPGTAHKHILMQVEIMKNCNYAPISHYSNLLAVVSCKCFILCYIIHQLKLSYLIYLLAAGQTIRTQVNETRHGDGESEPQSVHRSISRVSNSEVYTYSETKRIGKRLYCFSTEIEF